MMKSQKILRRYFSQWKPNIPKHKYVIDKQTYRLAHPIWNLQDAEKVEITHLKPQRIRDWIAFSVMRILRTSFDFVTGFNRGQLNERKYLGRFIFLETIAGVPGMIAGMVRHMRALRTMQPDGGWIHNLLEEAENERMHLFTFIQLRNPGLLFRLAILGSQGIFLTFFSIMYMLSSTTAHRFVGYLEEEAVKTYTQCIQEIDSGKLPYWQKQPAPPDAIKYWNLPQDSKIRDVIIAIRADECMHREFNHHFATLDPSLPVEQNEVVIIENPQNEQTQEQSQKERIKERNSTS